ncbi:2,3-diphosphoglycerate-dependent phosphoglycerate mutase [Patescibacteria group bacterium]|nr:2,3-diphosphoglycerate-dependent phosphoglycerate mutase [Patescibacteria group bacterium]MBU4016326.1 2,3-diphosphoglycerate-dependent phosphoglycerate mutase [Patescibacteria group bacterium]
MMTYLVLIRHGESEWNAKSLWTGWTDVELTEKGRGQARDTGSLLKDIKFDICFISKLKRAKSTWDEIRMQIHVEEIATIEDKALNERDYGDLTGKNKWKIKEEYGEEQFQKWRRSWDIRPPNGESLKDVFDRVIPYYKIKILPELRNGKNVIVVAHGNSLRALIKYLENIPDGEIAEVEIGFSEAYVYEFDREGKIVGKEVRTAGAEVA